MAGTRETVQTVDEVTGVVGERQEVDGDVTSLVMDSNLFAENLSRSLFATAQDEIRPVMGGVYFDLNADNLAVVATDGHKLVRNRILTIKNDVPASFILPQKPAQLLKGAILVRAARAGLGFDPSGEGRDHSAEAAFAGRKENAPTERVHRRTSRHRGSVEVLVHDRDASQIGGNREDGGHTFDVGEQRVGRVR